MKTRLLMIVVLLCTYLNATAQMVGNVKQFAEFKKRPLVVVLPEPTGEKDKTEADRVVQTLKSKVENYWTFNKDITYMTASEMRALKKKKKKEIKKLAVLEFSTWEITKTSSSGPFSISYTSTLSVSLLEDIVRNRYIYLHNFSPVFPSDGELISAMLQVQNIMSKSMSEGKEMSYPKEAKKNSNKLKEVTLLLDKNLLNENITEEEIKEKYGLPYKIVDTKEIEEAIFNKAKDYAYIYILPSGIRMHNLMIQVVLYTENSEVLAYSVPPRLRIGNSYGDKIGKGNLKDYAKYVKM